MRLIETDYFECFEPLNLPDDPIITDAYDLKQQDQRITISGTSRNAKAGVNKSVDKIRCVKSQENAFFKRFNR